MKVIVIGVSASGKTTFTKELAKKLESKYHLMDAVMWRPNWEYIGDEATAREIQKIIDQDSWILEGYITKGIRDEVFQKADKILYLDYPGWLSAWRYIKRWWKHRKNPRPELPGSPEKFDLKFLKLVYTKGEVYKIEKLFKENDWNNKIVRFKMPREARDYLNSL